MDREEALKEEDRRIRRLRMIVDLTLQRLWQDPDLGLLEALTMIEKVRRAALSMFPGKETAFDLIYRPRFERVIAVRWPHELPDEVGPTYVLGDPSGDA